MEEFVFLAIIGLSAGFVKGMSGFGSSLVAIPLLTILWGPDRIEEIVVIMITLNVVLNAILMLEHKAFKLESLKGVYLITITGVIFTFVGLNLLEFLSGEIVNYIAAVLIFLAILVTSYNLFIENKIKIKESKILQIIVGAFSGVGNGIASVDGPPVVFYLTGIDADKVRFKSTISTHFLVMGFMGVLLILFRNMYTVQILSNTVTLLAFHIVGLLIGILLSRRLNEKHFKIVIILILLVLNIRMLL